MRPDILHRLRCPLCEGVLSEATAGPTRTLRCQRGHCFDVARHGYVPLAAGRLDHQGDSSPMVAARAEFLAAGHYDFITAALAAAALADRCRPAFVVDVGAGTGHHLAGVLEAVPEALGLALDVSKPALRRAARSHPRAAAVLCDTCGRLPLASGSADLLLNVFAPRNGAEFRRVLSGDGRLLVATPEQRHLGELVEALGLLTVDPAKADRVLASLGAWFGEAGGDQHERRLSLRHSQVRAVVAMGPSAWHTSPEDLSARLAALPDPVEVTASVRVSCFRPR